MRLFLLAGAVFLMAAPVATYAQTDSSQTSKQTSDPSAQQEKKICRTERITGSLTRRSRICLTEREWARMAEGSRRNVDALDRDANQTFAVNPNASIQGAPNGPPGGGFGQ